MVLVLEKAFCEMNSLILCSGQALCYVSILFIVY